MSNAGAGQERDKTNVLLASARDWFASALQAVLEPEGFSFVHVRKGEVALREAPSIVPDLVIVDEGLPDLTAPELARRLVGEVLRTSVPVLVYSPNFWHERQQAEAMQAGAWDIIREPIRSRLLVAKLQRLLRIKHLIETTEEGALSDPQTGLFNLSGLMHTLPILASLAERSESDLSCAVLGPTEPASGETLRRQRRETARLCSEHTRLSDVCGWVGDADVALVVYNADMARATTVIRRLSQLAQPLAPNGGGGAPLSAGIVELAPADFTGEPRLPQRRVEAGEEGTPVVDQIASLGRFAAAQAALRQAREAGGGIRIAESD